MWEPGEVQGIDVPDVNAELNELYELKGRVEATKVYIEYENYINKDLALMMLGDKPKIPNAETPTAESSEVDE